MKWMNKHNCLGSIGSYLMLLANNAVNDIYLVTKHVWRGSMFRQLGEGELHRTDWMLLGCPARTGRGDSGVTKAVAKLLTPPFYG